MPSDLLPGGSSDKYRTSPARLQLRRLEALARRRPYFAATVSLITIYLLISHTLFARVKPITLAEILEATNAEARNYGDWVAKGGARDRLRTETPTESFDLNPRKLPPNAERIFIATPREDSQMDSLQLSTNGQVSLDDTERRGLLGGENWEWSSGVAGLGEWLGPLDMRKDAEKVDDEIQSQLYRHYRENAWTYGSTMEADAAVERLEDAENDPEQMAKLPLKDRVGIDDSKRDEAARLWTRIYGAEERWRSKSALELQVERLVRREPLVVFSKTTCPYSARAKQLLNDLKLRPPPFIVEYDVRPDAMNLKALLTRLTSHSTFPNVIIGGRSIGGSDDLARLFLDDKLLPMLAAVGVKATARPS